MSLSNMFRVSYIFIKKIRVMFYNKINDLENFKTFLSICKNHKYNF